MKDLGNVDSKYRFVIIASKRAKELLKGAKARIKSRSKNPVRIAQKEVQMGLVEFEILKSEKEDASDQEERVFLGEEIGVEPEEEAAADIGPEIFGEEVGPEEGEEEEEEEEKEADSPEDLDEEKEKKGGETEEED
ncbi:MAG: DNA-directed RNA polymerase subunit omega [Candidatus Aminicenantales bacterium]